MNVPSYPKVKIVSTQLTLEHRAPEDYRMDVLCDDHRMRFGRMSRISISLTTFSIDRPIYRISVVECPHIT